MRIVAIFATVRKNIMIMDEIKSNAENVIKYSENEGGRSFEARFSDGAAANVVAMFSQFLGVSPVLSQRCENPSDLNIKQDTSLQFLPRQESQIINLNRIFKKKGDSVVLSVKNLKAKRKTDLQARVCLLYLLYHQENDMGDVSRDQLYSFMKSEKLYSGGFRSWMSKNHALFTKSGDTIELSYEGEQLAQSYLKDVFDGSEDESKYEPSRFSTTPSTKAKAVKVKKSSQPQSREDLDLDPANAESLKDFMSRHHYKESSPQLCVLFVYYLKQIRKIEKLNQNHIYSCYRYMGIKLPKNLYHALADTISKNKWLMNISDLNLTSEGLNVVEHNMRKK